MNKNILIFFFIACFCNYELVANDASIIELEKRVLSLEKQVAKLKKKSRDNTLEIKWENLKRGLNKINIKKDLGNPDRVGKYLNGDEIWGFKNFTLKFDNNGMLKEWSKPFVE